MYSVLKKIYNQYIYIASLLCYCYLRLIGVEIGKGCVFRGRPTFRRKPNTVISIGINNSFFSSEASNLIGVNHKCILSTLSSGAQIKIGDNCGFSGTTIGCFLSITIGNNVRCGANTLITDSDWHNNDYRVAPPKPIEIGDNVWLGYGSVVMKGVKIGENSIIGLNSVVTHDIPANVVAAGNPCRVIRSLEVKR